MARKRKFVPAALRFAEASLAGLQAFLDASYSMNPSSDPRPAADDSDDANHPEVIQGHEAASVEQPGVSGDSDPLPRKRNVVLYIPREDHMAVMSFGVHPEVYEQPFDQYVKDMVEAVEATKAAHDDLDDDEEYC